MSDAGSMLRAAVEMLAALDDESVPQPVADARVAQWARRHGVEAVLCGSRSPGADRVEYDLYLESPMLGDGITVGLTWARSGERPWLVSYADHWAANFVLTVDGRHVTVQEALRELSVLESARPTLAQTLVRHTIEAHAAESVDRTVSSGELQTEIDTFRRRHGLLSREQTSRWLTLHGMTTDDLAALGRAAVIARRLRAMVVGDAVVGFPPEQEHDFDRLAVSTASFATKEDAARALQEIADTDFLTVVGARICDADPGLIRSDSYAAFALDVPDRLRSAAAGDVVGPCLDGGGWWVGTVHRRDPVRRDAPTMARLTELHYTTWLQEQEARAAIEWHWS